MPKTPSPHEEKPQPKGFFERFKITRSKEVAKKSAESAQRINQADEIAYGLSGTSIITMLGGERREIRDRRNIYSKWMDMESDSIVSTALGLLTTAALGGHETSAQLVFIEPKASAKKDKALEKMVREIDADLAEIFNNIAPQQMYTAAWGGDSYARIYATKGKGVDYLFSDENWLPPVVQPYEQSGRTVGYSVYTGARNWERLNIMQMARMKLQRKQFIPQHGMVEKALRMNVLEDDCNATPYLPGFVGGSLLHPVEKAYDDLYASLVGLVGQRLTDSISEETIGVNLSDMSPEQQFKFMNSVENMFKQSREKALQAVKTGRPIMEKIKHLLPGFGDKQLVNLSATGSGRVAAISIEDVMFHARLLSGGLGVDLSMVGFADQMAGGLGEGGFFRTSAHVAERARTLRSSMTDFFNHVIDVHTAYRYGVVFSPAERPWVINYYGSISALEAERQTTQTNKMNSGLLLVQALDALKNMGCPKEVAEEYLAKTMGLDDEQAILYATLMEAKRPEDGSDQGFGGAGAGAGGGEF